jgi:hypothetical protein
VQGVRGAAKLAATLSENYDDALLFKRLATLDTSVDVGAVEQWEWAGPTAELESWCDRLDAPDVLAKARRVAGRSG